MDQIRIVAAAMRVGDLTISMRPPARHHDLIKWIAEHFGIEVIHPDDQGFIDSNGVFRSRRQAKVIAYDAGQLQFREGVYEELYSEDVW